jgi:hypothetical protein
LPTIVGHIRQFLQRNPPLLDEFQGTEKYRMRHRRVRHHEAGIREAILLFGAEAGPVARLHIISDLKEEGWTEKDSFPKDEEDYVRMGLF